MIYLIADTHFGNPQCNKVGINRMLDDCQKNDGVIYGVGDILDFFAEGPIDMMISNCVTLNRLLKLMKVWVIGNHDIELKAVKDRVIPDDASHSLIPASAGIKFMYPHYLKRIDNEYWLFVHGHLQSGYPWLYNWSDGIEKTKWMRKIARWIMKSKLSSWFSRRISNDNRMRANLGVLAKSLGASVVVYGHSHIPGYYEESGLKFVNPGGFGLSHATYEGGHFKIVKHGV